MVDSPDSSESLDDSLDEQYDVTSAAVSSDYKVLGHNKATSGTQYGVLGQVDSTDGFGLYTPNDGKVDGTLATTGSHKVTVDGNRALALGAESGNDPGNIVGGHSLNTVKDGAFGTVLLGGGQNDSSVGVDHRNVVTDNWGVVIGGRNNVAGSDGDDDPSSAQFATVSGGEVNKATADHATVGGGNGNRASASNGTVAGGSSNVASGFGAAVTAGTTNKARADQASIGGGQSNQADGIQSRVGGGYLNQAEAKNSAVLGGLENIVHRRGGVAGGGEYNKVHGKYATISGGGPSDTGDVANTNNRVYDNYGTIGGGGNNHAGSDDGTTQDPSNDQYPTVAGGRANQATGAYSAIGGGYNSSANGSYGTVAGGRNNQAGSQDAAILGGSGNKALGVGSTVAGGYSSTAGGTASFAAGQYANAADSNSFVWNDGSGESDSSGSGSDQFSSSTSAGSSPTGSNTFHVKSTSGARFVTSADNSQIAYIPDGSAGWSNTSTRTAKTNIDPVDPESVLASVEGMAVSTWEYRDQDGDGAGEVHMGPMAEDFHEAFDLGGSDRDINSINADGVALGAIQGLAEKHAEKDERIRELEAENEAMREELAGLKERVCTLEAGPPQQAPADD